MRGFLIVAPLLLPLCACASNGSFTPTAALEVATAYNNVCPPISSGLLDPVAADFSAKAKAAYLAAKNICANGAPTNIVIAGLDILAVQAALQPYLK